MVNIQSKIKTQHRNSSQPNKQLLHVKINSGIKVKDNFCRYIVSTMVNIQSKIKTQHTNSSQPNKELLHVKINSGSKVKDNFCKMMNVMKFFFNLRGKMQN